MRFRLTRHAILRMVERSISKNDLEGVLRDPDASWTDPRNHSRAFRGRTLSGRALIVWVVDETPIGEPLVVKSAAWITKEANR